MAAIVPFTTIEGVVAAIAKIDIMHKHVSEQGGAPEDLLAPLQVNVVSQGDELLWDGASKFVNSETLRFHVGDSVKCLVGDGWLGGVVVRQPVQDGEAAAYDVLLADGRRLVVNEDSDSYIRAGDPRPVSSFQLIFAGAKVSKQHEGALAAMGAFGGDVQLVDNPGPPEVAGRMVAQLKAPTDPPVDAAIYEKTVAAAAGLLGAAVPVDWKEQRAALVQQNYAPAAAVTAVAAEATVVEGGKKGKRKSKGGEENKLSAVERMAMARAAGAAAAARHAAVSAAGGAFSSVSSSKAGGIDITTPRPRRPISAFHHFCNEMRSAVKAVEGPKAPNNQITNALHEKWVATEDKSKWTDLHAADLKRYEEECAAGGFVPTVAPATGDGSEMALPPPKKPRLSSDGTAASPKPKPKPKPKPRKKKDSDDDDDDDKEVLPWVVPQGFTVSDKPAAELLVPGAAEAKALVGRTVLYHWDGVGWCSGVIEKANGDKSKKVGGEMANYLVYYEMDDDLSRHVLELGSYAPDGPPNSWVLLEAQEIVEASSVEVATVEVASAPDDGAGAASEGVVVEGTMLP